jgi:hypothetical protein
MKNYTSQLSVEKTISLIERALAKAGASNILKNYEAGTISSISFTLFDPTFGKTYFIRLPANVDAVEKILFQKIKRPRKETIKRIREQAARTAWKLMLDWVEVQLSLIELEQVEALQVFLPYVFDGEKTFYSALKENNFRMLSSGKKEES